MRSKVGYTKIECNQEINHVLCGMKSIRLHCIQLYCEQRKHSYLTGEVALNFIEQSSGVLRPEDNQDTLTDVSPFVNFFGSCVLLPK